MTTIYLVVITSIFGCLPDAACITYGVALNELYERVAHMLQWTAHISASGFLLIYIALLTLLALFTTQDFRGRVVRT